MAIGKKEIMAQINNETKHTKQQYDFVCSLLWGASPVDRLAAEESTMYKTNARILLAKYPKLDISFFEESAKPAESSGQLVDAIAKQLEEITSIAERLDVVDTWNGDRIVYKGNRKECERYVTGANVYQMGYSKLIINRTRGDTS